MPQARKKAVTPVTPAPASGPDETRLKIIAVAAQIKATKATRPSCSRAFRAWLKLAKPSDFVETEVLDPAGKLLFTLKADVAAGVRVVARRRHRSMAQALALMLRHIFRGPTVRS